MCYSAFPPFCSDLHQLTTRCSQESSYSRDRATTATHSLHVTTSSQSGALSPAALNDSLRDSPFVTAVMPPNASISDITTSSTTPYLISKEGRTVRGRPASTSRRVSQSNSNSASASADRSGGTSKGSNHIGTLGICALDSKARAKPSRNILNRLVGKDNDFEVIIFGDKVILDEDVENWPICDFLISFFSEGFPLDKAIAYAKLRKPFCVNDLPMQTILWDRRICLQILSKMQVPTPERLEVNRDGGPVVQSADVAERMFKLSGIRLAGSEDGRGGGEPRPYDIHMEDDDDTLVVNGERLKKPFVEKPISGEDHNINIYYPKSQGGGGRRLFRKVNNKSSEKDENLTKPRCLSEPDASYIYEQFLKVENAEDVKAYTVGTDFCHAETRKSPVVDGVVKRNPNGKEIRYVTALTKKEQEMAAKIASGFGQRVCGFDLLRVDDKSYVIDVNGWSFVKDNNDYYNKCASILREMFIHEKQRTAGGNTPAEDGETRQFSIAPGSDTETDITQALASSGDKERAGHRHALKSVFRSRSVSRLRDHAKHAAHKAGHVHSSSRSASGNASPLSSQSTAECTPLASNNTSAPSTQDAQSVASATNNHRPSSRATVSTPPGEQITSPLLDLPVAVPAPASKSQWKLKSMVAVIRHADRTPKQKFKFTFHTKPFVDLLKGHQEEVLLTGEAALYSVQLAVEQALKEGVEDATKLRTLQNALNKKGAWPGTKVQIKPMFKKSKDEKDKSKDKDKDKQKTKDKQEKKDEREKDPSDTVPIAGPVDGEDDIANWSERMGGDPNALTEQDSGGPEQARHQSRSDSLSEVTMSRHAAADNNMMLDKLQLVMKWGGEPTHSARYQAADLGENMRNDLKLMNRDVLDDVSIFTSSEKRVKTSAQIFASGFLDQREVGESNIKVRKDLLDDSNAAKDEMDKVKKRLKGLLRQGHQAPEQFAWPKDGTPEPYLVVRKVVDLMKFHQKVMRHNFSKLPSEAVTSLERIQSPLTSGADADHKAATNGTPHGQGTSVQARWCTGEDAELFRERWEKLFNEYTDAEKVDPSKISELYDTMKFDALHNRTFLEWAFTPTHALLLEEDGERPALARTESLEAREAFDNTHNGSKPIEQDTASNLEGPPVRSTTASTTASELAPPTGKEGLNKERPSFSERMGLRRRSADLNSVIKGATPGTMSEDSYFTLYKGSVPAGDSKVRNDVRLEKLNELYGLSKILFDFIGPQEYGITNSEKLEIGLLTSLPLLREIVSDLEAVQASDDAKAFIYFTKESHIYTLLNCILEGGIQTKIARNAIPELDYLSQICFELYESENVEVDTNASDPASSRSFNYTIRITISPGCHTFDPLDVQLDSKHCIGCAPRRSLTAHGNWKEVLETLRAKFHTVKLPKSFTVVNLSEKIPQEFAEHKDAEAVVDEQESSSAVAMH